MILLPLRPASVRQKSSKTQELIIHGMCPIAGRKDRSIRSTHLKTFIVEYPVRVISVAILVATF